MKKKKSVAGQPQRRARDDQIMETWSSLTQHIVREETVQSEVHRFSVPESAAMTIRDDDDDEVRSTGAQRKASTTPAKGKGTRSRPRTTETATTTADTGVAQSDHRVIQVRIQITTCELYSSCLIYCS